jgi:hypothetical protein
MDNTDIMFKGSIYLKSKREICMACNQRDECKRPTKDTEDEDTSLYPCDKYTK